jgi:hypothetical protein
VRAHRWLDRCVNELWPYLQRGIEAEVKTVLDPLLQDLQPPLVQLSLQVRPRARRCYPLPVPMQLGSGYACVQSRVWLKTSLCNTPSSSVWNVEPRCGGRGSEL